MLFFRVHNHLDMAKKISRSRVNFLIGFTMQDIMNNSPRYFQSSATNRKARFTPATAFSFHHYTPCSRHMLQRFRKVI
jgi:hypothetical protein